ncbi:MAG: FAD-binding oxidoreductase [Candidatus Jordarchaeum sp.]|uniref:FAD-binding oxidoreductase n=1 Tax=Candidatus Jordarchaeum sp. TaxID=2823881 RepID=UPI00404B6D28
MVEIEKTVGEEGKELVVHKKTPNHEAVLKELIDIVGEDYVMDDSASLFVYSGDMTENVPHMPEFVVAPITVEEVQKIVLLANREKIPIIPFVSGSNLGGLTIPLEGGITVDLKRMNKILEVNEVDQYAIIEAGVTFANIKNYLDKNHPDLVYTYTYATPAAGVVPNALLEGLATLSTKYGTTDCFINGLEAVLPTGEIVRVGSGAVSKYWFGRNPLPDLVGLFTSWQGMTGIVTKMAIQLDPKPAYSGIKMIMTDEIHEAFQLMLNLGRAQICDNLIMFNWGLAFAVIQMPRETVGSEKMEGAPSISLEMDISAINTLKEFEAKVEVIEKLAEKYGFGVWDYQEVGDDITKVLDVPMTFAGLFTHGPGGLTWVGAYGPCSQYETAWNVANEVFSRYPRFTPWVYAKTFKHGHFGAMRTLVGFDRSNAEEVRETREIMKEMAEELNNIGFIPYKAPVWATEMLLERGDPNFGLFLKKIKKALDPNRIMNPGRWGL